MNCPLCKSKDITYIRAVLPQTKSYDAHAANREWEHINHYVCNKCGVRILELEKK